MERTIYCYEDIGKCIWVRKNESEHQYSVDHCIPVDEASNLSVVNHLSTTISHYSTSPTNNEEHIVALTETIPNKDPRGYSTEFKNAIQAEIDGLVENSVYDVVDRNTVLANANIMGGRFVLTIKNLHTPDELQKAHFVAQGHTDREKHLLIHPTTALRHRSVRILLSLAALLDYPVWMQDISQAYLQSRDKLSRTVYIRPPPEFNLPNGKLLRLNKPLYRLSDAGDYWSVTITDFTMEDQLMQPTTLDISLFFKKTDGKLSGMSGFVVDDGIHTGNVQFQ